MLGLSLAIGLAAVPSLAQEMAKKDAPRKGTSQMILGQTRYPEKSYKKECQEKNLPSRPDAGPFSSRHSAQLFERAPAI